MAVCQRSKNYSNMDIKSIYKSTYASELAKANLDAKLINEASDRARESRERMEAQYLSDGQDHYLRCLDNGMSETDAMISRLALYGPRVQIKSIAEMTRVRVIR